MRALLKGTGFAILAMTTAAGGAMAEKWPDLPEGIKNGVSGQSGSTAFVGLGSAGDSLYSLDISNPSAGWTELAAFPGPATDGAASAVAGGKLFVFSGSGKENADDKSPIIFSDVYVYDPGSNSWSHIDNETPAGLLGAKAHALDEDRIAIIGGYNKDLFDKYLHDVLTTDKETNPDKWNQIVDDYMGMEPADYKWNTKVLVYTISTNSWSDLGDNPYLPNCGSALVEDGNDVLLISGEIKPGLRTPQVKRISFGANSTEWEQLAPIPARAGDDLQEGVAGSYAGYSNGALLVAGGANFPGARAQAFAGNWFTHAGLPKTWNSEIYAQVNGAWKVAGVLPEGLGYGASFVTDEGVLIVGGEDSARAARADVFQISWDGDLVKIDD